MSPGTLKNLARIGLLPEAGQLRPNDVVLARIAHALGSTRSTNRDSQQDERTTAAIRRDYEALAIVAERLLRITDEPLPKRSRLIVHPAGAKLITHDYQLLEFCEDDAISHEPFQVLPIGAWHIDLQGRLAEPENHGQMDIAA
ncbi:hypothetical protein [Kitasatospora sp. NPDC058046]|uniref:hypothetical protein n=1 Tax=Kitasatospora sp. NPDC058046 TaxID=3346312 RepID=UPI0036DD0F7A